MPKRRTLLSLLLNTLYFLPASDPASAETCSQFSLNTTIPNSQANALRLSQRMAASTSPRISISQPFSKTNSCNINQQNFWWKIASVIPYQTEHMINCLWLLKTQNPTGQPDAGEGDYERPWSTLIKLWEDPVLPTPLSLSQAGELQLVCFKLTGFMLGQKVCWWTNKIFGDQAEQDMPKNKEKESNFSSANPSLSTWRTLLISNLKIGVMSPYYTVPCAPFWDSAPQFLLN